jgi:uracil-DNA glycosylase
MSAAEFVPRTRSLRKLATAAEGCRGCELYESATQTVFGAGPGTARIMFVGEQPGDVEDRCNEPFVGPAGKLLNSALAEAGIAREERYLTNAVKHFRWKATEHGQRRIHDKPAARHVTACRPWLAAEISALRPQVLVALGAVAAQSLFYPSFRLTEHRGRPMDWPPANGPFAGQESTVQVAFATIHPSAALRAGPDRQAVYASLVQDLKRIAHS